MIKKTLLTFTFLFCAVLLSAQFKNETYVCYQPGDMGIGLRYDRDFNHGGLYMSGVRGEYNISDVCYINNHIKIALGGKLLVKSPIRQYLTAGIAYHRYIGVIDELNALDPKGLKPFSFELGACGSSGRFAIALTMDILKWEGCINFGVSF